MVVACAGAGGTPQWGCANRASVSSARADGSASSARLGRCVVTAILCVSKATCRLKRSASLTKGARITISAGGIPSSCTKCASVAAVHSTICG